MRFRPRTRTDRFNVALVFCLVVAGLLYALTSGYSALGVVAIVILVLVVWGGFYLWQNNYWRRSS